MGGRIATDRGVVEKKQAVEQRIDPRMMCAELVEVHWNDKAGRLHRDIANLEDISLSGACVQLETHVQKGTRVTVNYGDGEMPATVRYCLYRDLSYFLGLQFEEGCKWSTKRFRPQYMLDPRELVLRAAKRHRTSEAAAPRKQ
jgi:PilZ domain